MSQMLLEIWPIVLSAAILFGLFRIRQHTAIEHWANWNLVFTGASIIGGAASLKLFAKLSELSSLLDTLTLYYFHILSFGSILLLIGLSQQIPLIARMVQVDGLLRQMLVELGSAPNHKSYDAVELASQVQSAIRQHQLLLADLQRSQATNEALIAAMPDMLFQISAEGIFLNNLTPQHTSHYTPTDQFIGMNIADFLEPALSETILNCIETVQTSQLMQRLQHEFTIGKLPRHLEARFLPNADGTAMAIVRDVTQEANLFQELSRSKKRYQTLLHHSNDAIIIHTPTGEFTDANQRAADLFGYPMDELMATGWENLLGENVQEMIAHARESLETDGYLAEEFVLQRKDGERLFGHISSTLIEVDDAPLVICIVRDVSQQKRDQFVLEAANIQLELARNQLEDRVAQRTDALQQANHDLEMLLYVVSHDLKEPLRAIENFSLLVNRRYASDLDMKGQDFLRRVVRASERMRKLIDDILQLSRARRMETNFEEVASRTLVDEVLERLETQIEESEALIWVSPDLPELHVNVTWATQAIYNLVSNALKYSSAAQAPDIQIDVYDGLEQPGLVIRDRGIGIQPMHAERIFELFQRAVGREVEGTGAGLAIVREVAQRHRGNVWVQPHAGGGSEFYITFGQPVDIFDEVFI